nr:DUF6090 family protein [uncultured Psychroserpens sp.]
MITLFRQFRQRLLSENKFSKYFIYASGEIILVVVGILIALSINNWNENSKLQAQELKLLKQLKSDLTENKKEIIELRERISINSSAMDTVVSKFKNKIHDTRFDVYATLIHRKSYFNNANSGYQLIGNISSTIISNDSILKGVLQLYEKDFVNIGNRQNLMNSTIDNRVYPLTNKLFKIKPLSIKFNALDAAASDVYTPLDFESLSNNHEYINTLLQLKRIFEERLNLSMQTNKRVEDMILLLEDEIKLKD